MQKKIFRRCLQKSGTSLEKVEKRDHAFGKNVKEKPQRVHWSATITKASNLRVFVEEADFLEKFGGKCKENFFEQKLAENEQKKSLLSQKRGKTCEKKTCRKRTEKWSKKKKRTMFGKNIE